MVEEQQLLKTLRWYDGFVIALANPGFLLGSLGYSVADLGGWGAALLWGISAFVAVFINTIYSELAAMFPAEVGRALALRPRGLAEVHDARRADRDVRLLDRLVGRALLPRPLHRAADPGRLVPGRADREPVRRRATSRPGGCRVRPAAADRDRPRARGLAVQRLRRADRHGLRLRRRRDADDPALRDDDPAVPERQLRQRQPHVHAQRPGARVGWPPARARLALDHVLVGVGGGRLCDLRARVQGHGARHEDGAALGGAVLDVRLHRAADRVRRRRHREARLGLRSTPTRWTRSSARRG